MPQITVTPILVADLFVEGERMALNVHVIDHPDARILVDTGMTVLHPIVVDALKPTLYPLDKQEFDLSSVDIVVNTHLHGDHCGGNHLFAGRPFYVQRRELEEARRDRVEYPLIEWVDAPGVEYTTVDGEHELLPGIRLLPAPGHTPGLQIVVIDNGARPTIVGGDVAVWFGELEEAHSEGQKLVHSLNPEYVWLAHEDKPWSPKSSSR